MSSIIKVKGLGKKYKLRHERGGYVALRDKLAHPIKALRAKASQEEFWALKGVDFEVKKGEVLGIIGANGAGKSTLLKILSRITPPSQGEVIMSGRVSSLLEVGTGFHPELTGRENIYLNGAILGMSRQEIEKKFNEIVEFSGVEAFLDTPVKRYSSGMQVRLAFAVAAHLEPDILVIDEVLAVGDAAFQKKSLGKMEQVTKEHGRTILFVSHNMDAVAKLCTRCILLEKGKVKMIGEPREVINEYLAGHETQKASVSFDVDEKKPIQIRGIRVKNSDGMLTTQINALSPFSVELDYDIRSKIHNGYVGLSLIDVRTQVPILDIKDIDSDGNLYKLRMPGSYTVSFNIDPNIFNQGIYRLFVYAGVFPQIVGGVDKRDGEIHLSVVDVDSFAKDTLDGRRTSLLLLKVSSETKSRN